MQDLNISQNNFEQCLKCSLCTTVCPMMAANPHYPGPKQAGPDGERYRLKDPGFYDLTLKYCLNCKRCEVACPSGVRVGDIIQASRLKYGRLSRPLRDITLANTDFVGSMAVPFAPIVNGALSLPIVKIAMDAVLGVDRHRTFPSYSRRKFTDIFKKDLPSQEGYKRYVSYFHGCYVNYNYPQLGVDFVTLMNACGYGVRLLDKEKCCGVALISNGLGKQASVNATVNMASMRKALDGGSEAVLTSSSTCTFTMRDEYDHLLGIPNEDIRPHLMLAVKFIYDRIESGQISLAFKEMPGRLAYHTPCHMQKLGWTVYSTELLKMIPGLDLQILPQECCGISGTFGFKKENYPYSQKIGAKLFETIRDSGAAAVITDCETCKWQIEMSSGYRVHNPITVLMNALDLEKTKMLNAE